MYFEDFVVGQRFVSDPRRVTELDRGPLAPAAFFGMWRELDLTGDSMATLLDTNSRYLLPVRVEDALRAAVTITRCSRTSAGDQGVVNRHVALRNQADELVQTGETAFLVRARGDGPDPAGRAFCTPDWGAELRDRLGADSEFGSTTANWDGTIGLRCGQTELHLRIYRGAVIEVARRVPLGATFTFGASELTWTELVTGQSNDFMRRAMCGEFDVSGNGYEYLRLTKAMSSLIDNARELARDGQAV